MSIDLNKLTPQFRQTPDGKFYALGFAEFGDQDFFKFTIAEVPTGPFESNLAVAEKHLDDEKKSSKSK